MGYQRLQELFPALQNETWENHTCIKSIITATALNVLMDTSPEQTEGGKQLLPLFVLGLFLRRKMN